jgi:hypothetical protein
MNDASEIIRKYLTVSGTSLYTLVSNRVSTPVFPTGFTNTQAAIMFYQESGRSHRGEPNVSDNYFIFRCYGGTASHTDARAVFLALQARLHTKSGDTTSGGIVEANCVIQIQAGTESDTGYPVHVSRFEIVTR